MKLRIYAYSLFQYQNFHKILKQFNIYSMQNDDALQRTNCCLVNFYITNEALEVVHTNISNFVCECEFR